MATRHDPALPSPLPASTNPSPPTYTSFAEQHVLHAHTHLLILTRHTLSRRLSLRASAGASLGNALPVAPLRLVGFYPGAWAPTPVSCEPWTLLGHRALVARSDGGIARSAQPRPFRSAPPSRGSIAAARDRRCKRSQHGVAPFACRPSGRSVDRGAHGSVAKR